MFITSLSRLMNGTTFLRASVSVQGSSDLTQLITFTHYNYTYVYVWQIIVTT